MEIHTEQRRRVSVLVGELIALGLKYGFQDLPDAVPPQRVADSVCSLLSSLPGFILTSELLDFVSSLQQ